MTIVVCAWLVCLNSAACQERDARSSFSDLGSRFSNAGNGPSSGGTSFVSPDTHAGPIAGNPAATEIMTGSGLLGDFLGVNHNGFRVGGLNITSLNDQISGGLKPGHWTSNSLTLVDLSLDTEESYGWRGGRWGGQFLYYSGGTTNDDAGTVMGYNSLDVTAPRSRVEIYQLWYRQKMLDDRLTVRFGKMVPTADFNNVVRSIPFSDGAYNIPAVSSAILTPLFVNPTQLGIMPGYYNSAFGATTALTLPLDTYLQYGWYDGNLAAGRQTGLSGPHFNGFNLHILEAGADWTLGAQKKPGKFGIGGWKQTGELATASGSVNGADGMYLFLSQRLYYEHPDQSDQGISAFVQYAATNSAFIETHRYFGCGLTYFGPLPSRDHDSMGVMAAYGKMNDDPALELGSHELIYTTYYQCNVSKNLFVQPNLTYIDDPAQSTGIPDVFAFTMSVILLF
ncbi:carbohydrate porin [Symmachiella dynata]|nr:carbohydrate porin [Symmachiella dynata]